MGMRVVGDQKGSKDMTVDKMVGIAYPIVRHVSENIEYIKHVSENLQYIYNVGISLETLNALYANIHEIREVYTSLLEIREIFNNMERFNQIDEDLINLTIRVALIESELDSNEFLEAYQKGKL